LEGCRERPRALEGAGAIQGSAGVRATPIHPGEGVIAIGYPYPGLLSSEFAVTTGIVSSLGGIGNDSRYLQISAPVQPGNSGGPLLDTGGNVVGVVAMKIDAVRVAQITGTIRRTSISPLRPVRCGIFWTSTVPYKAVTPAAEEKTAEIAE